MTDSKTKSSKPSQHIVVGFDVLADQADSLQEALAFATMIPGTAVEVVWVPPMAYIPGGAIPEVSPAETLNARVTKELTKFGLKKLADAEIRVTTRVGEGRPAQELSRVAFMHEASMIIVGSHDSETSLESFLLGSVAKKLVQIAPCPVLVMRPKVSEAVPELEEPLEDGQARRRIGIAHRYHSTDKNVQARENMPLLFPMEHS